MGEMRFLPFRAGPPPVFEGGGLEAGSELSAWTETSQAVSPTRPSIPGYSRLSTRLFGGGRGAGANWITVGGDNIRYRFWTFFPGAVGTKGSLRSASADNLSEDVLSAL